MPLESSIRAFRTQAGADGGASGVVPSDVERRMVANSLIVEQALKPLEARHRRVEVLEGGEHILSWQGGGISRLITATPREHDIALVGRAYKEDLHEYRSRDSIKIVLEVVLAPDPVPSHEQEPLTAARMTRVAARTLFDRLETMDERHLKASLVEVSSVGADGKVKTLLLPVKTHSPLK